MLSVFGIITILALATACDDICTYYLNATHECQMNYSCRIKYETVACVEEPCQTGVAQAFCSDLGKDAENPCKFGTAFVDSEGKLFNCNDTDVKCPHGSVCETDPLIKIATCCSRCHNPGNCPVVRHEHHVSKKCYEECELDGDCGAVQKCCFNGCGQICMEPIFKKGN